MKAKVWVYPGMAAWRFLLLPVKEGHKIKEKYGRSARGWGSLPVSVTIKSTTWKTSIFPDKRSGSYLLPLKAEIRKKEKLADDSTVSFTIKIH